MRYHPGLHGAEAGGGQVEEGKTGRGEGYGQQPWAAAAGMHAAMQFTPCMHDAACTHHRMRVYARVHVWMQQHSGCQTLTLNPKPLPPPQPIRPSLHCAGHPSLRGVRILSPNNDLGASKDAFKCLGQSRGCMQPSCTQLCKLCVHSVATNTLECMECSCGTATASRPCIQMPPHLNLWPSRMAGTCEPPRRGHDGRGLHAAHATCWVM